MTSFAERSVGDRSLVQTAALLVGVVFLAVGILGFVPGITSHYGDMSGAGQVVTIASSICHTFADYPEAYARACAEGGGGAPRN